MKEHDGELSLHKNEDQTLYNDLEIINGDLIVNIGSNIQLPKLRIVNGSIVLSKYVVYYNELLKLTIDGVNMNFTELELITNNLTIGNHSNIIMNKLRKIGGDCIINNTSSFIAEELAIIQGKIILLDDSKIILPKIIKQFNDKYFKI